MTKIIDIVKAARRAVVIEQAAPLGGRPMWALHYYERGRTTGGSIARGDELADWIADLIARDHVIAGGWQLRDQPAPETWPTGLWLDADGWPTDAYWYGVENAFDAAGVEIAWHSSEGRHDRFFQLAPPYPGDWVKYGIGWNVDEDRKNGEFTGRGWYWRGVASQDDGGGRWVEQIDLGALPEPIEAAQAVATLVHGGAEASR